VTIELPFDERERPCGLVGVLGRDEEERSRERAGDAVDGHLPLLHRLEQRRLGAGGGAVQLVDEDDVREQRAGTELPLVAGEMEHGDAGELGREEVGSRLDPPEGSAGRAGQGLGEQRLADTGDVVDEEVSAGEETHDRESDRLGLAAQDRGQAVAQLGREAVGGGQFRGRARVGTHHEPVCRRDGARA
jgi:hypothetical protein